MKAACEGLTDLFFPDEDDEETIRRAKAVCHGCEMKEECLEMGMKEQFGIWGGTTEVERRKIRRRKVNSK